MAMYGMVQWYPWGPGVLGSWEPGVGVLHSNLEATHSCDLIRRGLKAEGLVVAFPREPRDLW